MNTKIKNFYKKKQLLKWSRYQNSLPLNFIMATATIKLFQFSQNFYTRIGIYPNSKSFNWKNLLVLFVLAQFFISSFAYFLFKAKTIGERADSFYFSLTALTCVIFFLINISKIDEIRNLIDNFEAFIQKSKYK